MSNKTNIQFDRCYVLYNCETKDRIGVFKLNQIVKFVFGYERRTTAASCQVHNTARGISKRIKQKSTQLPFDVTVRYGKKEDFDLLGDADMYLYKSEYEQYFINSMKSSDITRRGLAIEGAKKLNKIRGL